MRIRNVALGCIAAGLVSSCSQSDGPEGRVDVPQWQDELPIAAPWLRDRLPATARFYARIPHPLGILANPKGNVLGTALGSEANVGNMLAIQESLATDLLQQIPPLDENGIASLLSALRSPIEIAAFGPPNPSALIAMTLDVDSNAGLEALLSGLVVDPNIALSVSLDDDGIGQVLGPPVPVFVRFDAATGQLLMHGAALATRATFSQVAGSLEPGTVHAMQASEARIDESGQGLFAWLDVAGLLPMARAFAPPGALEVVSTAGLDAVRSLALGFGVANGKGRLSLLVDVGENDSQRRFPVVANTLSATAAGTPKAAAVVSIPTAEEFARLEALYLGSLPPDARESWEEGKAAVTETTGVVIEDLLAAVGPELILISDEAGEYAALRQRDGMRFDAIVTELSSRFGVSPESMTVSGTTLEHWSIPSVFSGAAAQDDELGDAAAILGRFRDHYYTSDEGEFLYISTIPQPLIDRALIGPDTSLSAWLDETQRVDFSSSLFAATGSFEGVPRRLYYGYLGAIQSFADIAGSEIDMSEMPTARQLGLPSRGALGFAVNLGEPFVSIDLSYESNPGELLFGGGAIPALAMAGVLAAIAVPAYQDYTIRAQVSEGMSLAAAAQTAVAESFESSGGAPDDRLDAGLSPDPTDSSGRYVASVEVENGSVVITYGNEANAPIAGQTLVLTPYETAEGTVLWRCGAAPVPAPAPDPMGTSAGDAAAYTGGGTLVAAGLLQYLPAACRP